MQFINAHLGGAIAADWQEYMGGGDEHGAFSRARFWRNCSAPRFLDRFMLPEVSQFCAILVAHSPSRGCNEHALGLLEAGSKIEKVPTATLSPMI